MSHVIHTIYDGVSFDFITAGGVPLLDTPELTQALDSGEWVELFYNGGSFLVTGVTTVNTKPGDTTKRFEPAYLSFRDADGLTVGADVMVTTAE